MTAAAETPFPHRTVVTVVAGIPASDGAGVKLKRVIGQPGLDMVGPFLMLDEFGSDRPNDYIAGFPDHPHRGFETVTYMIDGRIRHRRQPGQRRRGRPGGRAVDDHRARHRPFRRCRSRRMACCAACSCGSTCRRPTR